ncbi:unnamed protein product [Arctogadus glacialis]
MQGFSREDNGERKLLQCAPTFTKEKGMQEQVRWEAAAGLSICRLLITELSQKARNSRVDASMQSFANGLPHENTMQTAVTGPPVVASELDLALCAPDPRPRWGRVCEALERGPVPKEGGRALEGPQPRVPKEGAVLLEGPQPPRASVRSPPGDARQETLGVLGLLSLTVVMWPLDHHAFGVQKLLEGAYESPAAREMTRTTTHTAKHTPIRIIFCIRDMSGKRTS